MIESGIDSHRMSVVGNADTAPLLPNRNADGTPNDENRAKNRRIQIKIEY
jgi:flagellar motor protein MotB